MGRWVLIIISVLAGCVVVAVLGGKMLLGRVKDELSEPIIASIATSVEASVSQAIRTQTSMPEELRLTQLDLDINTVVAPAGESGFEVTTNGDESTVLLYGATTAIEESGITVTLVDLEYHAIPHVQNDRVEFESSGSDGGITGWMLDVEGFEEGFETGINNALAAHDLTPVGIELSYGQMAIAVSPES